MTRAAIYYNVRPRYSPGSPASVDQQIAEMVANDERRGHKAALEGFYGEDRRKAAEEDTLRGLSEQVTERTDCWIVQDLITDERYIRPFQPEWRLNSKYWMRLSRLRSKYRLPLQEELPKTAQSASIAP